MVDFQSMFMASKGQPITFNGRQICMVDKLIISKHQEISIVFQSISSNWRQGIHLSTVGEFNVGRQRVKRSVVLWNDTAPEEVRLTINSADGLCNIKNVWDVGDGVVHSWHGGAAMLVFGDMHERTYYCNDGKENDDFNDLVFRVTLLN